MLCERLYYHAWIVLFVLSLAGPSAAQAPAAASPGNDAARQRAPQLAFPFAELAPARSSRLPQLDDLTQVKLVTLEGERQLVMMLESFRTEEQTGMVTKFRQELRTRTVRDEQGRNVEQTYTVTVPYREAGEVELKIPAGRKPVSKPASLFRFFDLNRQELSVEQASNKLSSLRAAFLLDRFAGELPELPELYREAINQDCLVIVCEERLRDDGNQPILEALPARDDMPKPVER